MKAVRYSFLYGLLCAVLSFPKLTAAQENRGQGNRPERLEWFLDLGFGLFPNWGLDAEIGGVMSHMLVGASKDFVSRYINELPKFFNPTSFNPEEWARLARVAGARYVVFDTKHHSGFCMFNSATNDFNVMHTPYGKDITAAVVKAFRAQGIAIGFYYSPDDFYVLHQQGKLISRRRPEAQPINNPELMASDKAQVRELLTQYGTIDIMFFDGPAEGLRELTWELQPNVVITRGAMKTPEIAPSTRQNLPSSTDVEPWEANFTMGTSWQYKPTNEKYKSGTTLIEELVETRAKGGNMLLNIGPMPNGEIPLEQQGILREIGLWMFVNGEAIYEVRPWVVPNEDNIWFTKKRNEATVYAFVTREKWEWGKEKTFSLKSVRASSETQIRVLGQNDLVLEYEPAVTPRTSWRQDDARLHITATRSQRLYNDRTWPNPVVIKITHARSVEAGQ